MALTPGAGRPASLPRLLLDIAAAEKGTPQLLTDGVPGTQWGNFLGNFMISDGLSWFIVVYCGLLWMILYSRFYYWRLLYDWCFWMVYFIVQFYWSSLLLLFTIITEYWAKKSLFSCSVQQLGCGWLGGLLDITSQLPASWIVMNPHLNQKNQWTNDTIHFRYFNCIYV